MIASSHPQPVLFNLGGDLPSNIGGLLSWIYHYLKSSESATRINQLILRKNQAWSDATGEANQLSRKTQAYSDDLDEPTSYGQPAKFEVRR